MCATLRAPAMLPLYLLGVLVCCLLPATAAAQTPASYVVDKDSVGGPCNDARTLGQVSAATPWCTIVRAVKTAPSGSTVLVRDGDYPYQQLHALGSRTDYVTLQPFGYGTSNPEQVSIAGLSTANTSFLRFRGFHLIGSDGSSLVPGARVYLNSSNIEVIDNEITGQGILLQTARHVLLKDNYVHALTRNCSMASADGFGMYLSGGSPPYVSDDIRVVGNDIRGSSQDALNLGNLTNVLVKGNDVTTGSPQCGDHMDLIQIEGLAKGPYIIRNNFFHDGSQFILRNAIGLRFENNLILRVDAWMQLFADPGARIVNNTWWGGNQVCTGCGSVLIPE